MKKIGVIGAGAWGTSLAIKIYEAGNNTLLWALEPDVVEEINATHTNSTFLKNISLPNELKATADLKEICKCDIVFMVAPAQFNRLMYKKLKESGLPSTTPIVLCSKGIENQTLNLMSEVLEETLPDSQYAVLSGPSFADEVANGQPFSVSLACADQNLGKELKDILHSSLLNVFLCDDVIGAQIGGSTKNVVAIACGLLEGKSLGNNAVAALMTQGLREMTTLCLAKGGQQKTMLEPCGVGDLVLTCSSTKSRNTSLGYALANGKTLDDIMNERTSVAEGFTSSASIFALGQKLGIELPVCEAIYGLLHEGKDVEETIMNLVAVS